MSRSRHLIARLGILLALLGALASTTVGTASASPSSPSGATSAGTSSTPAALAAGVGDYSGNATANLVHVSALNGLPGLGSLADIQVIPATADVNSAGTPQSTANAKNAQVTIANSGLPLQEATQTAAPDNPTALDKTLVPLNASPLANVDAVTARVHARWLGADACVPVGTPISSSIAQVANVQVLPGIPGLTKPVLSLDNQAGGTGYTDSTVGLTNITGQTTQGVVSNAVTQVTGINLAGQFTLNVVAPLQLTAIAGGTPGSAKVIATQPIIQVLDATGTIVGQLDASTNSFALPNNPLINLSLGAVTKSVDANGLTASADGSLLDISVLAVPGGPVVAHVLVGEAHADATAPAGGIKCPAQNNPLAEVHKDASAATVAPGGTFTYTITVPNRGDTEIDDLKVIDHITGPAGSSVVATSPQATSVNGLDVSWSDPTPLQPNETRNYTITVQVPTSAKAGDSYTDTATASGTYNGQPVSQTVTLPDVPKVGTPPFNGCHPNDSNKAADHLQVTPNETFVYYVHVLNDGNQPCTGLTVSDTLTGGVSFVSCTNSCTHNGQTVTWTVPDLGPGSSVTLAVTVKVNADATGTLPNDAVIHQPGGPDIPLHTNGPIVTTQSVLAPPHPPSFGVSGGNVGNGSAPNGPGTKTPLAYTGWSTPGWILLGLLGAVALALGLTRRVRRQH